jgi:hypothetical protein
MVLSVIVSGPTLLMPPPKPPVLPEIVEPPIVSVPWLMIPPAPKPPGTE